MINLGQARLSKADQQVRVRLADLAASKAHLPILIQPVVTQGVLISVDFPTRLKSSNNSSAELPLLAQGKDGKCIL
jgi:hypothetical protein